MKKVLVFAFAAVSVSSFAQTLWYNGDFNDQNGLSSERNTVVSDARTYDNFVSGTNWVVDTVWGNFLVTGLVSNSLYYEIRSGVTVGNGGALLASGTVNSVQTATGRSGFGLSEIQHKASISRVALANNTEYWLTVAPIGNGGGRAFVSTTSGNDAGPGSDPNPAPVGFIQGGSFFDSPFFGVTFGNAADQIGDPADFSFGVGGVPEPASMIVLGGALAALAARRRRK